MKTALRVTIGLVLALMLPACSMWGVNPLDPPVEREEYFEDITLVNQTGEAFYYYALELETSHRVDPLPAFDPAESPFPLVDPGASVTVEEIAEYSEGDDVRFFLYALRRPDDAETPVAKLVSILTVSHEELVQAEGRVVVASF